MKASTGVTLNHSEDLVEISLRKLKEEGEKIQIALYSADGNFFLDKLKLALNHSVQLAHEVYTFAEEYQRLGVNNLLYLKQFEKFNVATK